MCPTLVHGLVGRETVDGFVDPHVADRMQGLELRIIEVTRHLERARSWPGHDAATDRLERMRGDLVDELGDTARRAAESRTRDPKIDATHV